MNARFWTRINGDVVKITIKPGQEMSHFQGNWTEEGFIRRSHAWEFDGQSVVASFHIYEKDCDGPFENFGEHECFLNSLRVNHADEPEYQQFHEGELIKFPQWALNSASQRDHYAESMGY
jgi:hypothetical protein